MSDRLNQPKIPVANILVVDDKPANLRLLSSMLAQHNYKVRPAPNGAIALKAAAAARPDLILLDINMPGLDGYQVCQKLKEDEATRDIPVIFISALDETLDKVKAFSVGGVDYITKPFQFEEVLARLETHLTIRRLQIKLEQTNAHLEERVRERTIELAELNYIYERFVPREFLSYLGKESILDLKLGDQTQREMTVLFTDIRDFTTISEKLSAGETFQLINRYLGQISPIVKQHQGFVDKYMGDGLMALFAEGADHALQAAIEMCQEIDMMNPSLAEEGLDPLQTGIGLHTGALRLGVIGGAWRWQGTVIADAVNLAARLEGLTKLYGVSILISEATINKLADPFAYHIRFLGTVQVKGKMRPVSVYEVFDSDPEEIVQLKQKTKADFEEGLNLYYGRQFSEAQARFEQVLAQFPTDAAFQLYLQRAKYFLEHGVSEDWNGVERFVSGSLIGAAE